MNAYELAEDIEFVAANYIAIIGELYMMDVAHFLKEQADIIVKQTERIADLEKKIYGSR